MDYLEYFGLSAEPFSHAPLSRFYYASRQHTEALKRLMYAAQTMKGLAILVGDIGHGKTTLARRLLDSLPSSEFEAAMLVIVHAGVTANWLLKRIATQLGVPEPADDKLTILSQLYARLVEIHQSGRRAVVLIDEAQMLATREIMEEFRGLLNLEVPDHKLISFVFFGLPDVERNLQLDPPLAQRVALRCHLSSLSLEETIAYVQHRLRLAGAKDELFPKAALAEVHRYARGVPRSINTLCDNVLLELFFAKLAVTTAELVFSVADNLGMTARPPAAAPPSRQAPPPVDAPVVLESAGEDAVMAIPRRESGPRLDLPIDADAIAARVASEGLEPNDLADFAPSEEAREAGTALAASMPDGRLRVPPAAAASLERRREGRAANDIEDPLAFLPRGEALAGPRDDSRRASSDMAAEPAARSSDGSGEAFDITFDIAADERAEADAGAAASAQAPAVDVSSIRPKLVVPAPTDMVDVATELGAVTAAPALGTMPAYAPEGEAPAHVEAPAPPAAQETSASARQTATETPAANAAAPATVQSRAATLAAALAETLGVSAEAAIGVVAEGATTRGAGGPGGSPASTDRAKAPTPGTPTPIRTKAGTTIDLNEIDDLLADIKRS